MPAWIYDILLASAELERTAQLQPCLPWLRPHLGAGQEARASFNITFWQRGMC